MHNRLEAAIEAMRPQINGRDFLAWAWHFDNSGRTEYCRQPHGWEVIGKSPKARRETPFLRVAVATADGEQIEVTI